MPSGTDELILLGTNHASAPVELRERLACLAAGLAEHVDGHGASVESVSLITCNRVELYLAGEGAAPLAQRLANDVAEQWTASTACAGSRLYRHRGIAVARHLFRVAAGLDSLVLGETEVLGQVGVALARAREQRTAGPLLTALFQAAVRAGRRVRAETGLAHVDASVSVAAVELAASMVPDLARASVVIVGTGKMGEVALRALEQRRVADVQVVGRTPERVACLAGPTRRAVLLNELSSALARADVVISATAAPHPVITPATLAGRDSGRPLVIVDIAVPRDVDPAVCALPGVHVFDIDDLTTVARRYRRERAAEARRAERIVQAEVQRFAGWLRARRAAPSIAAAHRRAQAIRRAELSRVVSELNLGDHERCILEAMTNALVKRLLHDPFVRLKEPDGLRLLPVFDELFVSGS